MYKINSLGSEPRQEVTLLLADGTRMPFTIEYRANQLGWFFGFEYNQIKYQNIRLTTSYNILRAYRSWLPFGIRCSTLDGLEPMDLDDFSSGYATIYLLPKEDVEAIESNYYVKVSA